MFYVPSSVLLFALTAACGDRYGFGVPVDTDTVDTSDTQDTNGQEDTLFLVKPIVQMVKMTTVMVRRQVDEDCDGEVSVDFDGKTGFCEFGEDQL